MKCMVREKMMSYTDKRAIQTKGDILSTNLVDILEH